MLNAHLKLESLSGSGWIAHGIIYLEHHIELPIGSSCNGRTRLLLLHPLIGTFGNIQSISHTKVESSQVCNYTR